MWKVVAVRWRRTGGRHAGDVDERPPGADEVLGEHDRLATPGAAAKHALGK
jgi:hypothetical protein